MARQDYRRKTKGQKGVQKGARSPRGRKPGSVSRSNWFVGGFAIGVLLTVGLFTSELSLQELLGGGGSGEIASSRAQSAADVPGERGKPRFEFYTLLPEMEVPVPDEEIQPPAAATPEVTVAKESTTTPPPEPESGAAVATATAPVSDAGTPAPPPTPAVDAAYILQVGSFRHPQEADRLRANLVLLGLKASVQTVAIDGEDAWHRVRIGPYRDLVLLNNARVRLRENGISVKVWRVADGG